MHMGQQKGIFCRCGGSKKNRLQKRKEKERTPVVAPVISLLARELGFRIRLLAFGRLGSGEFSLQEFLLCVSMAVALYHLSTDGVSKRQQ